MNFKIFEKYLRAFPRQVFDLIACTCHLEVHRESSGSNFKYYTMRTFNEQRKKNGTYQFQPNSSMSNFHWHFFVER